MFSAQWARQCLVAPFFIPLISIAGCAPDQNEHSPSGEGGNAGQTSTGNGEGDNETGASGETSNESAQDLRAFFESTVLPGLQANCGACHSTSGIADFLAPPDPYESARVYNSVSNGKPLLGPIANESVLYAFPDSKDHYDKGGLSYGENLIDLKQAVLKWLEEEAKSFSPPDDSKEPAIVPFYPHLGGFNTTYLDPLGEKFQTSSITFTAVELGNPPSILELRDLEVHPAYGKALRIAHPRFGVYPANSTSFEADPADSLASVDATFVPQEDPTFGTGKVFLTNWQKGARLSIDFSLGKIESLLSGDDGEIIVPCKNVNNFTNAVMALGDGGPAYCAKTCHGGNKAEAKAAMNLSYLLPNQEDYNFACASMRSRIHPGDVEGSQIMNVTNPKQPQVVHMFKFKGDFDQYKTFKAGMTQWITNEQ